MNKNTIIFILVVALIIFGGVIILRRGGGQGNKAVPEASNPVVEQTNANMNSGKTEEQAAALSERKTIVVTYTDSGFSPNSVTIKNGQAATFKNESSGDMWVASAPHPTHTDYPEFDAKKAYKTGESYFFTFTKTGTWKYHNHMNPSNFGMVVVE